MLANETVLESSRTEAIEDRLEDDGIKFNSPLSTEKKEGYYVSAEETDFNKNTENSVVRVNQTVDFKSYWNSSENNLYYFDEKEPEKSISEFLQKEKAVQFSADYEYSPEFSELSKGKYQKICLQRWNDIEFMDSTGRLELDVTNENGKLAISFFSQTHLENIEPLREKQELFTEKEAITTLYNNSKIPKNAKIMWTKLAYARNFKVRGKNVYIPVWFVAIEINKNNIQLEQVNALNNTVISNMSVSEVKNE